MNIRLLNEKAFTLIEVIVSMVLIAIIGVIAGMGLVQIANGYVFAKLNAETVQKAQITMARINKELRAATSISSATLPTAKSITYTRPVSTGSTTSITNTITITSNGLVTININGGATAYTLTDKVVYAPSSFSYTYVGNSQPTTTPTAAQVPNIFCIDITLVLSGANSIPCTLKSSVVMQESYL
jgi:prepilin-type N-terminal cleavage/methylation domain-containing protein